LDQVHSLRQELLTWFERHQRDLPWRKTRDPYRIWLSEIMLQQTRVAAVIPYFERFLARFPTVESLADVPEADLLSHWAGLGYYYRARNLQKAAQAIVLAGAFPASYEALLMLPGIGDYTAAAVASIAFDLPHAVLDGNVFRVLSRLFADRTNIADARGKKHFAILADRLLDRENPAAFNQAMMELGATICLPKSPQCLLCPVAFCCKAREQNQTADLPVKIVEKKSVRIERTLYWIQRADRILAWQRPADSRLMPGFWELPEQEQIPDAAVGRLLGAFKHGITIYDYRFRVVSAAAPVSLGMCQWVSLDEMEALPLSTIFRKAMRVMGNQKRPLRVQAAVSR
jgi:A/G-specific adenine glycosylase